MLSFGTNDFFQTFFHYNNTIWPMPLVGYVMGIIIVFSLCYENPLADKMISLVLAFLWMWIGIVEQISFFTRIDTWANLFGILFITQSLLLIWAGVIKNKLVFRIPFTGYNLIGTLFIIYALIVYPILSYFMGHMYPEAPVFGVAARPTAIFTFGIYLFAVRKFPIYMMLIPLTWSLIGFTVSMVMGVREDFPLFVAGISCLVLTIIRNKTEKNQHPALYAKLRY
jgi:hypothetical protein